MCVAPSAQWHARDVCGAIMCNMMSALAPLGAPAWCESVRRVWVRTNVSRFNPAPVHPWWCSLCQLSHHQRKQVANNWFDWVLLVLGVLNVLESFCFWMYFRKPMPDHCPINMIEQIGTPDTGRIHGYCCTRIKMNWFRFHVKGCQVWSRQWPRHHLKWGLLSFLKWCW